VLTGRHRYRPHRLPDRREAENVGGLVGSSIQAGRTAASSRIQAMAVGTSQT